MYEISGIFCLRQNVNNVIWRLTLRRMLAELFEFKCLCKNVAFVVDFDVNTHNAFVHNF